jgi:hypothetical protein
MRAVLANTKHCISSRIEYVAVVAIRDAIPQPSSIGRQTFNLASPPPCWRPTGYLAFGLLRLQFCSNRSMTVVSNGNLQTRPNQNQGIFHFARM